MPQADALPGEIPLALPLSSSGVAAPISIACHARRCGFGSVCTAIGGAEASRSILSHAGRAALCCAAQGGAVPVDEAEAEHRRFIIDRCRIAVQVTPTPPPLYSHFSTCRPSLFAVSWAPGTPGHHVCAAVRKPTADMLKLPSRDGCLLNASSHWQRVLEVPTTHPHSAKA